MSLSVEKMNQQLPVANVLPGESRILTPGDSVVIPPGTPHAYPIGSHYTRFVDWMAPPRRDLL